MGALTTVFAKHRHGMDPEKCEAALARTHGFDCNVIGRATGSRLDLSAQKEQFSHAYVRAVAAVAGFAVAKPEVDDDSVDLSIKSKLHSVRPQVDVQLKCSETI